ncbi:MAG TPA: TolC family protein [Verrucomicrobiae bacterium]|nr:TolC family protein [Verrucomicrobiae bacterium]
MRLKMCTVVGMFCLALSVRAQIETNRPVRPITLEEAIRLALENNLQIARVRFEPQIAEFRLSGRYAYYEPAFEASAGHRFNEREGQFNSATGLQAPASKTDVDSFGGGLRGVLPYTGLRYEISSGFDHTTGSSAGRGLIDEYAADVGITMTQPLLRDAWIDARRLDIKLGKKDVKISEYAVMSQVMDVVNNVQQAFYDLIGAIDAVKAREISLSLAQRLVSENTKRVQVGTLAPLDEKQAESEAALRRAELIQARSEVTRIENILKSLISSRYEELYNVGLEPQEKLLAVPQTYDLQESWQNGLMYRPDYLEAKERLERQGIVVSYTRNQLFPALDLVGSYGRAGLDTRSPIGTNGLFRDSSFSGTLNDIRDEVNPRYSYGVTLTVPLTFRSERAAHNEAKALLNQTKIDLQQVHQNVLIGIDDAMKAARAAYERVQATRAAREFAEIALEAEQKKLDNGRSTSFIVLQLQRNLTDNRAQEIDALSDYNKAIAVLHLREGTILKKNNVRVEIEK